MYCPNCGHPAEDYYTFCPNCGCSTEFIKSVNQSNNDNQQKPVSPTNGTNNSPKSYYSNRSIPNQNIYANQNNWSSPSAPFSSQSNNLMRIKKGSKKFVVGEVFAILYICFFIVAYFLAKHLISVIQKMNNPETDYFTYQNALTSSLTTIAIFTIAAFVFSLVFYVIMSVGMIQSSTVSNKFKIAFILVILCFVSYLIPFIIYFANSDSMLNTLSVSSTIFSLIRLIAEISIDILLILGFVDLSKQINNQQMISRSKKFMFIILAFGIVSIVLYIISLISALQIKDTSDYSVSLSIASRTIIVCIVSQTLIAIKDIVFLVYLINTNQTTKAL